MDYITEDFLKIIEKIGTPKKWIYDHPVDFIKKDAALELSDKVTRFEYWKCVNAKFVFWHIGKEGLWFIYGKQYFTLSELYNHWKLNIDKK